MLAGGIASDASIQQTSTSVQFDRVAVVEHAARASDASNTLIRTDASIACRMGFIDVCGKCEECDDDAMGMGAGVGARRMR
jgi:hypothetical protein